VIKYIKVNLINFLTRILYTFIIGDLLSITLNLTFILVLGINTTQGYLLHKFYSFKSKKKPIFKYITITLSLALFEWYIHKTIFQQVNFQFVSIGFASMFIFVFRYLILKKIF